MRCPADRCNSTRVWRQATPRQFATRWTIRLAFLSLFSTLACGGKNGGADTVPDIEGPYIDKVEIVGNEEVPDDDITDGLATRGPEGLLGRDRTRYDPLIAQVDVERIESYYQRRGFFEAEVRDVDVEEVGDEVRVEFEVVEGEPTRLESVLYAGIPDAVASDQRIAEIRDELRKGEILSYPDYREVKLALRNRLVQLGYMHATVDGIVSVERDENRGDIAVMIDPGPRVRFGDTNVVGLDGIPPSSILARLGWEKGDHFDPRDIEQTEARLYQLGFFRSVRVELPEDGEATVVEPLIRLEHAKPREVRLGGGFAADNAHFEIRGRAGYRHYGFFDPLTLLRLDVRPGYTFLRSDQGKRGIGGEATAELERYDLFTPLLTGNARVSYRLVELAAYTTQGPSTRLGLGMPFFNRHLQVGGGWTFEYLSFSEIHPGITPDLQMELDLEEPYRLGHFEEAVSVDFRDDILNPRRGFYLEGRLEQGGAYAGGEFDYMRATGEGRGYYGVADDRIVLASRVQYGRVLQGDLPITRRYYSGGASSHRGFSYRRLSPTVVGELEGGELDEVVIGGEALLESNWEVRFDAFTFRESMVGLVAFADGADVVRDPGDISLTDLHWAAGLGLRYATPVGPLRLDVGRRITRTGEGNPYPGDVWAFHISVGEAF